MLRFFVRVRDSLTKSLYLYRRGHALVPGEKKLGEHWRAFEDARRATVEVALAVDDVVED